MEVELGQFDIVDIPDLGIQLLAPGRIECLFGLFQQLVDRSYEHGKAINAASYFEIDDVIDPATSRRWITTMLAASPSPLPRAGKKRPNIDTW